MTSISWRWSLSPTRSPRIGLAEALHHIADRTASVLFLPELGTAAHSLPELVRLLGWLQEADAQLVAVAPALDTASTEGRAAVAVLREIERWEREPVGHRRPRGRPSLTAGSPELARQLAELRERGMSLQAIADQLNRDKVPTPRGGTTWRPSSVQSALGYRRPRPPVPGAPPPKRPRKPQPKPHGPRGRRGPGAPPPPRPPHGERP